MKSKHASAQVEICVIKRVKAQHSKIKNEVQQANAIKFIVGAELDTQSKSSGRPGSNGEAEAKEQDGQGDNQENHRRETPKEKSFRRAEDREDRFSEAREGERG
ncbi:hypothetical protein NPIL_582481 [Nephila pilipes]|uniref:Uncharacterized protein n=1 Tax=Nephila pilipes TaxID=299642 RepID=A0A8X6Q0D8_NEPPI|nr:hypothetical protein NPIL_582481 [Nephila pilipes]